MSDDTLVFTPLDVDAIEVLLCDADGNLFGSEEPAFAASAAVTNRLLAELGDQRRYTADALRRRAMGATFRSTALALAAEAGLVIEAEVLERWVVAERQEVVAHLRSTLQPSAGVGEVLTALSRDLRLCVVSSSASSRVDACLRATGLDDLFPDDVRFSAEDSLAIATTKPDPAIYRFAGEQLGVTGTGGLAVEDAVAGVRSAVTAGFPTVGNLHFVPPQERPERVTALRDAGVAAIVPSWPHLAELLASTG